jgi:hypothetical protein
MMIGLEFKRPIVVAAAAAAQIPRFRALALLRRLLPAFVVGVGMAGVRETFTDSDVSICSNVCVQKPNLLGHLIDAGE